VSVKKRHIEYLITAAKLILAFGRRLDSPVFVFTDAFFGKGAPVKTCRADEPHIDTSAKLALCFALITPDLYFLSTFTADDVFRLWLFYILAARTFVFKHIILLHIIIYFFRRIYDIGNNPAITDKTASNPSLYKTNVIWVIFKGKRIEDFFTICKSLRHYQNKGEVAERFKAAAC
jgi:hypothetical protein